jgi:hypothetical protein
MTSVLKNSIGIIKYKYTYIKIYITIIHIYNGLWCKFTSNNNNNNNNNNNIIIFETEYF